MIDLTNIHSLSAFQRNAKQYIQQIEESDNPIILTVNGEAQLVLQSAKAYQKLLQRLEYAETVNALREGIEEIEKGKQIISEEKEVDQFLQKANQAYLNLRNDPQAWQEELEERQLWETILVDED